MDFNALITAIGSLGFPIVACILMGYMFIKFTDNYRADIKSMTEIVNNNTLALNKLIDKLDDEKGRNDHD
jgi:hypothetical protein